MLYVTTRDSRDAYTANRALSENRGPEGGFYVPMRLPHFEAEELKGFLTFVKESLGEQVKEVRLSANLGDAPVCMVFWRV